MKSAMVNHDEVAALHTHALEALEDADFALAHAPQLPIDGPHRSSDLTRETVSDLLRAEVPDAALVDLELADNHDGMTSRTNWNLTWNRAGREAGLPTAVFVKSTPEEPYHRETLALLHMGEVEVRFYQQLQSELSDLAPTAYYGRSYPGGRYLLMLEVLEKRGLEPYWMADTCSLAHAKAVAAALARLHAQFWETDRFSTDLAWARPRTERFGFGWHHRSYVQARKEFLASDVAARVPTDIIDLIGRWQRNDRAVYAYWERLPATVLHGDSHLGNTFSYPDGRAGFFDWQLVHRGYGMRDLAQFFMGAADDELRPYQRDVVDHYLDHLEAGGVTLDRGTAWSNYCLFALESLDAYMKTTMRGGYGHAVEALERSLQTKIATIRDNDVAGLLDRVLRDGSL